MRLTAKEAKLVERLRKQERQWRFTRWILIMCGVVIVAMWVWMLRYLFDATQDTRDKEAAVLLHALVYPKVLFGMIIGAAMIGFAVRDWWGSPTRGLLLRLLEEHQTNVTDPETSVQAGAPPTGAPATPSSGSGVPEGPLSAG